MPFCVSSFAALVKDRGFILVFSPQPMEIAAAVGLCLAFCGLVALAKQSLFRNGPTAGITPRAKDAVGPRPRAGL